MALTIWSEGTVESSELDPQRADLRQAAETLEQALTEACASRPAHEENRGADRVEEMLALASDAARRAISIRRKARHRREPDLEQLPAQSRARSRVRRSLRHRSADIDYPPPIRRRTGGDWTSGRSTRKATITLSALRGPFRPAGWVRELHREARLSPIPSGWMTLPLTELRQLCEQASTVPHRVRGKRAQDQDTTPREE